MSTWMLKLVAGFVIGGGFVWVLFILIHNSAARFLPPFLVACTWVACPPVAPRDYPPSATRRGRVFFVRGGSSLSNHLTFLSEYV